MRLDANEARKALTELPARQPKRLFKYIMGVALWEASRVRESTKWLHAIHGDPFKGRSKKDVRRELGLIQEEEAAEKKVGWETAKEEDVTVTLGNPPENGMPRLYLDGLSEVTFTATSQVSKGQVVVTRYEVEGRHTGTLLGVAPSNRILSVTGITWISFDERDTPDGKKEIWAIGEWTYWDLPSLMEQLGVAPV